MIDKRTTTTKKTHLKVALIIFTAWLFVVYVIIKNIQDLGGMPGLVNEIKGGVYSDLILLLFSISLYLFIAHKDDSS